ncbi:hypothetical protein FA15DRAFT_673896 [Coprinopsis marcescibilis]|uniref:Uncharacterized protein n=1 Tax=Coprinopsis marcescibilis TaxID=230819 RepID=A0A5C3KIB9_COPMA|nr:hypothetical protein FA15DRAFT_673896 [Coprinopsis marcescibilis]
MVDVASLPQRGRSRQLDATSSISMPTTPSAPIRIPSNRRPTNYAPPPSNFTHTVSPDTVFEMSPVTSEFAGPPRPSFSLAQTDRKDSFLYNLPSIGTRQNHTIPGQYNPIGSESGSTLSGSAARHRIVSDPLSIKRGPPTSKSSLALDEYELSFGLTTAQEARTKTSGFSPMRESRDPINQNQKRRLEQLSPGPGLHSVPSPWVFPGRGDAKEDDLAYSQTDPSALEFQRHLLDRIASQTSSRINPVMRSYT